MKKKTKYQAQLQKLSKITEHNTKGMLQAYDELFLSEVLKSTNATIAATEATPMEEDSKTASSSSKESSSKGGTVSNGTTTEKTSMEAKTVAKSANEGQVTEASSKKLSETKASSKSKCPCGCQRSKVVRGERNFLLNLFGNFILPF